MNPFLEGALSLRRRSVWEALDSGILLWRNNFAYFIPFFALPAWVAAFCFRLLPGNFAYLSYLILWWLKPFFDRLLLHIVSGRFFAAPGTVRLRELGRGMLKTIFRFLLGDLLWRRFSPWRAARMPIRILEQANRKQYRLRKKTLAAGGLNFCSFISFLLLVMEAVLLLGEILFVVIIAQMFFPDPFSYMRDNMETMELFIYAAYCFNFIIAESLYVCMGFALYINSRVEIEGWDLQLLFQKFSGTGSGSSGAVKKTVLLLCLLFLLFPAARASPGEAAPSQAEAVEYFPPGFPAASQESAKELEDILASPDFGSEKQGWGIRLKANAEKKELPDINLSPWLEKIKRTFGLILRSLVFLVLAGFAGFALYWFLKHYRYASRSGMGKYRDNREAYTIPFASSESPESLFAKAENFYGRGLLREAWASCLAGCIGIYTRYRSLSFPVDATEYDCLELVRQTLPAGSEGFGQLVRSWVLLAYGGRTPGREAFEQALAFGRSLLNDIGGFGEP